MRARLGPALALGLFCSGCAHEPGAEEVGARYRDAWRRRSVPELRALSTEAYRHRVSEARLEARLRSLPGSATGTATLELARLRYSDGVELELIREAEGWRVRGGGPDPDRSEDPLGALSRFLSAFLVHDLEVVRSFIPLGARDRYTRDLVLLEHLRREGDRARAVLEALASGRPELRRAEDEAELRYAPGRAVRMRLEAGEWRVLDLD